MICASVAGKWQKSQGFASLSCRLLLPVSFRIANAYWVGKSRVLYVSRRIAGPRDTERVNFVGNPIGPAVGRAATETVS